MLDFVAEDNSSLVWRRVASVRPTSMIADAPAWAKASAMAFPIPPAPPVTKMTLPAAERDGLVGAMSACEE